MGRVKPYFKRICTTIAACVAIAGGLTLYNVTAHGGPHTNGSDNGGAWTVECPPSIKCIAEPLSYDPPDGDPQNSVNFERVDYEVRQAHPQRLFAVHVSQGTMNDMRARFAMIDPKEPKSYHFGIDRDGTVYQFVRTQDIAHNIGNRYFNLSTISIGLAGYSERPDSLTEQQMTTLAALMKHQAQLWHIPLDRDHIVGHDNVTGDVSKAGDTYTADWHWDPGPYFNWDQLLRLVGAPRPAPSNDLAPGIVAVVPDWTFNVQLVDGVLQRTNFVHLRTEPRLDAPLITDPLHGPGTTAAESTAARVFYGQRFVASQIVHHVDGGSWVKIWVNGTEGWFFSPDDHPVAANVSGKYITVRANQLSAGVYGQAVPDKEDLDKDWSDKCRRGWVDEEPANTWIKYPRPIFPGYKVMDGQKYVVVDDSPPTQYYYAWTLLADETKTNFACDGRWFVGAARYIQVQYGNHVAFVAAATVDVN